MRLVVLSAQVKTEIETEKRGGPRLEVLGKVPVGRAGRERRGKLSHRVTYKKRKIQEPQRNEMERFIYIRRPVREEKITGRGPRVDSVLQLA